MPLPQVMMNASYFPMGSSQHRDLYWRRCWPSFYQLRQPDVESSQQCRADYVISAIELEPGLLK